MCLDVMTCLSQYDGIVTAEFITYLHLYGALRFDDLTLYSICRF
jgi:hypothetical protein